MNVNFNIQYIGVDFPESDFQSVLRNEAQMSLHANTIYLNKLNKHVHNKVLLINAVVNSPAKKTLVGM